MSPASQSSIRRTRPMPPARPPTTSGEGPPEVARPGRILAQLVLVFGIGSLSLGGALLFGTMLSTKTTAGRWTEHAISIGLNPFAASISGIMLLALTWVLREVQLSRAHAASLDQQNLVLSRQNEELYRKIVEIRNQDKGLLLDRIYNLMESLRAESQHTSQTSTVQQALIEEIHNLITQQAPHVAEVAQSSRHSQEFVERVDQALGTLRGTLRQVLERSDGSQDVEKLSQLLGDSLKNLNERFGHQGEKLDALNERLEVASLVEELTRALPDSSHSIDALTGKVEELQGSIDSIRREAASRSLVTAAAPSGAPSAPPHAPGSAPSPEDLPTAGSAHDPNPRANSQHFKNALTKLKNLRDQKTGQR